MQQILLYITIILINWAQSTWNFELRWDSLQNTDTVYGKPCFTPCSKREENYYWCYHSEGWGCCSPPNMDTLGNKCISSCVTRAKDEPNKCDTSCGGIGICSIAFENPSTLFPWSTYYFAVDASHEPNHSVTGAKCQTPCSFNGKAWKCSAEGGPEEDCGVYEIQSRSQYTVEGFKCSSPCITDDDGINRCRKPGGVNEKLGDLARCSLFAGLAINNDRCTSSCYGGEGEPISSWKRKNWCTTVGGDHDWNYCSISSQDPDIYASFISQAALSRVPFRQFLMKNNVDLNNTRRLFTKETFNFKDHSVHKVITTWKTIESSADQFPQTVQDKEWNLARKCLQSWVKNKFNLHQATGHPELAVANGESQDSVLLDQLEPAPLKIGPQSSIASPALYVNLRLHLKSGASGLRLVGDVQAPLEMVKLNGHVVVESLIKSMFVRKAVQITQLSYAEALQLSSSNKVLLNITIYKSAFLPGAEESVNDASKSQLLLAVFDDYNNDSPVTMTKEYSKVIENEVTFTTEKVESSTDIHSVTIAAGFEFSIPLVTTVKLDTSYKYERTNEKTLRESKTETTKQSFSIKETMEIPPCTIGNVSSSISVIDQLKLEYELYMKVEGVHSTPAEELRKALPVEFEYVTDFSPDMIIAKTKSKMVVRNAGVKAQLVAKGEKIKNCGQTSS